MSSFALVRAGPAAFLFRFTFTKMQSYCVVFRVDRPKIMLISTVMNMFIVLGLTVIRHPQDIW